MAEHDRGVGYFCNSRFGAQLVFRVERAKVTRDGEGFDFLLVILDSSLQSL